MEGEKKQKESLQQQHTRALVFLLSVLFAYVGWLVVMRCFILRTRITRAKKKSEDRCLLQPMCSRSHGSSAFDFIAP